MGQSPQEKCIIRSAAPGEAKFLSELALRSKAHWGYPVEFIEACREELRYSPEQIDSSSFTFAVAEISDAIIGFYALERLSHAEFELEALFVEPEWIGQAIGRTLLEHAKRKAAKVGGESLIIQGDPNAEAFYQAAGGVVTGRRESVSVPGRFLPIFVIAL